MGPMVGVHEKAACDRVLKDQTELTLTLLPTARIGSQRLFQAAVVVGNATLLRDSLLAIEVNGLKLNIWGAPCVAGAHGAGAE